MKETIIKTNKTKRWFFKKIKKIEIISSIFSDCNAVRLNINYKKKNCRKHKHTETKQHVSK